MGKETVTYDKKAITQILRDLNLLVVSTDRIGSAESDYESAEQYNAIFVRFFNEIGFFKKLADARAVLSDAFSREEGTDGMSELERMVEDLKYWGE